MLALSSVDGADRPAEPDELTCHGDRDDRAALAAFVVKALPGAVQPALCLPADRRDVLGLAGLSAGEFTSHCWSTPIVPGSLNEQSPCVLAAGLRDRPLPALLTAGVLRRDEAEVADMDVILSIAQQERPA